MKRKLIVSVLAVTLCGFLVGCGGDKKETPKDGATKANVEEKSDSKDENNGKEDKGKEDKGKEEAEGKNDEEINLFGHISEEEKKEFIEKSGFDMNIIEEYTRYAMDLTTFGQKVTEYSTDGVLADDEKKSIIELINNIDKRVTKIETINKLSKEETIKSSTESFVTEMRAYKTLIIEGLEDEAKLLKANEHLMKASEHSQKVLEKAQKISQ